MPQSLSNIVLHLIFSTKDRHPFLTPDIAPNLHAYLAATSRNLGSECYRAGGVADHVHLAVLLPRTLTTAKLVETLKSSSSKWLKDQSLRRLLNRPISSTDTHQLHRQARRAPPKAGFPG